MFGAGAAILEPSPEPGFISSAFRADGSYAKHWGIYAGGTAEPTTVEAVKEGRLIIVKVPLEGGGRLVVSVNDAEAQELHDQLAGALGK